jgi:hypothetical protein
MGNRKNVKQQQHVDVDKNPNETPGESLYDKETRESREKLANMAKKKKPQRDVTRRRPAFGRKAIS